MKPLGMRAYGSIGHLPGSRTGATDRHIHPGQARICCEQPRDKYDRIIVQEKLDGSCMAVAKVKGKILALGRAGYLAGTSPFEQHHKFAEWVGNERTFWSALLKDGERLVGEWLYQAHGTKYYGLEGNPWYVFDLIVGHTRLPYEAFLDHFWRLPRPQCFSDGAPCSIDKAMGLLGKYGYLHAESVEGAVWRVERKGKVDFLAKFVRSGKKDGQYLPGISGNQPLYNVPL